MLNLYLAPRGKKSAVPTRERVEKALTFLAEAEIIGNALGPSEYAPGNRAGLVFHADASNHLLPVEMTFGSLHVNLGQKETFLPAEQPVELFSEVACGVCDEPIDDEGLDTLFDSMAFFPVVLPFPGSSVSESHLPLVPLFPWNP